MVSTIYSLGACLSVQTNSHAYGDSSLCWDVHNPNTFPIFFDPSGVPSHTPLATTSRLLIIQRPQASGMLILGE